MTESAEMIALKQRMKSTWMAGDFGQIARINERSAEEFVGRLGLRPGMKVLDVACGTGNQSIPAARTGADITGVDIASNLLEQSRERARKENLKITFVEGDAEELPHGNGQFDVVLTMFGAMFAPLPERVASELLRVCRPGGLIAMGNWTPKGFVGKSFSVAGRYVPLPPGVVPCSLGRGVCCYGALREPRPVAAGSTDDGIRLSLWPRESGRSFQDLLRAH